MKIVKRDGSIQEFDKNKIKVAIIKANKNTDNDYKIYEGDIDGIVDEIVEELVPPVGNLDNYNVGIEDVQDAVELVLSRNGYYKLSKNYAIYRYQRQVVRESKKHLMDEVAEKLGASNIQRQNANVDEKSFGGRMGEATRAVTKDYALNNCMSEMSKNNHLNNEIYIHDLDSYSVGMHNCLTIPFDKLLANGFNTRQTDVRPANSVSTAFQLVAVIFQIQSLQQFGGVSASHLDWTMVPYVRKSFKKHYIDGVNYILDTGIHGEIADDTSITDDNVYSVHSESYQYAMDMTEKEVHQAVEGMYHNLNTLQSRSGNQLPFTSINYGTCTLPEGRMVTRALLEVSIEGLGRLHKTSIFPCGIFQCMKGINRKPGDPNYDLFKLALRSTAQRLYPNYVNVDWSVNEGYDRNDPRTYTSTMGKRKLQLM